MLQRAERMKINGSKQHDQICFFVTWKIANFELSEDLKQPMKEIAFPWLDDTEQTTQIKACLMIDVKFLRRRS